MDIEIVEKEDFEVIGKVAEGESEKHSQGYCLYGRILIRI